MLVENGVVKVGLEIEVAKWKGRTYQDVCADLVRADYMLGPAKQWRKHHKYHCNCDAGGCRTVRGGDLIVPPLVAMTYDGTLPQSGAEFIVSPVLLADLSLRDMVHEIWDIIVRDAEWRDDLPNYHDTGHASPSVHMHVSATKADGEPSTRSRASLQNDLLHSLELFAPELFMLADLTNYRRGLKFRLPTRDTINEDQSHHGFVHVRRTDPRRMIYLEWRLFEAAYDDWEYVEAAAYIAAALTRAFLYEDILSTLMKVGYGNPYNIDILNRAAREDDTSAVLDLVDSVRLDTLKGICLEQLEDDAHGQDVVKQLFQRLEAKV